MKKFIHPFNYKAWIEHLKQTREKAESSTESTKGMIGKALNSIKNLFTKKV